MRYLSNIRYFIALTLITICNLSFCKTAATFQDSLYTIKIQVLYELNQPGDTLILHFGPQSSYGQKVCDFYVSIVDHSGKATFNIAQPYPYGYFSIEKTKKINKTDFEYLADNLFWESGDNITMKIKQPIEMGGGTYIYDTDFTGVNAGKYRIQYEVRKRKDQILKERSKLNSGKPSKTNPLDFSPSDRTLLIDDMLAVLDSSKSQLDAFTYQVLKANIMFDSFGALSTKLVAAVVHRNLVATLKDSLSKTLMETFFPIPVHGLDQDAVAASTLLSRFYAELFKTMGLFSLQYSELDVIRKIVTHTDGAIRESILCRYLDRVGFSPESNSAYSYAEKYIYHKYYQGLLKHIKSKSSHNVNKYVFKDMKGSDVVLSDFNGKLVLIDVWFTGCGGCIRYRQDILSKIKDEFKDDERLKIISINGDKNESMWKKSVSLNTYADPEGVNLYTGGRGMLHPFIKDLGATGAPTPILIDRHGYIIDNDSFRLRDVNLLRDLINKHL